MTRLFDIAADRALHMSRPQPPKISIGIEISQPPMDGGLSSIQRSMNIGGEPHKLGYLNFKEDKMLKDMGALGEPVEGTRGVPAYIGVTDASEAALSDWGLSTDDVGYMGETEAWTEDDLRERAAAGDQKAIDALQGERTGPGTAAGYGKAVSTPEAQEALARGRDARYWMAAQPTKYTGPLGGVLDFIFGGFPGSGKYADKMAGILEEGLRANYWGKRAYHDKEGIKLDYPETPSDIDTDPTKQLGKPKRKPKEEEKEKSAMEKYLDSIAGKDDDDSDDDDVSERQKWWDDLPDYLKDILKKTYPEEDEYGIPKDLFTDSV